MKRVVGFFICSVLLLASAVSVFALDFSGEPGEGTFTGRIGSGSGFALCHATPSCDGNSIIGYRFSVYDQLQNKRGRTIDIYRSGWAQNGSACTCTGSNCPYRNKVTWSQFGYYGTSLVDAQGNLLDKLENKSAFHQKEGYSLISTLNNKFKETTLPVSSYFPNYVDIQKWLSKDRNIDVVVSLCLGEGQQLNYKDMLLVEPIFCCFVAHYSCGLTVSDLARLSYYYYGDVFPKAAEGAGEFAWIRSWALLTFPNMLSVTDGTKAGLIGLKAGTKLKSGAKPSATIDGAYGMVLCTELSDSKQPPRLQIEGLSIYEGENLVQQYAINQADIVNDYLTPDTEYRFVVKTSKESTPYPCRLTIQAKGAMEEDFEVLGLSSNTFEFKLTIGNEDSRLYLTLGEDWVSNNKEVIQYGQRMEFGLKIKPKLVTKITFTDTEGRVIERAYQGQRVNVTVSQKNESEWTNSANLYQTEVQGGSGIGSFSDSFVWSLGYLEEKSKKYEVVMEHETTNFEVKESSQWQEEGVMVAKAEGVLPLCKAELELFGISLFNENKEPENINHLLVGKRVWPGVFVKTNTETPVTVLVSCSVNGEVQEAFKATLTGEVSQIDFNSFLFTEEKSYEFKVNVSMPEDTEDEEIEENYQNNEKTLIVNPTEPVQMEVFKQNVVMPGDVVITALKIENRSFENLYGNSQMWISLVRENGSKEALDTETIICPMGESTYLPIKWTVPENAHEGENLTLECEYMLFEDGIVKSFSACVKVQEALYVEAENLSLRAPANLAELVHLEGRLNAKYVDNSNASGEMTWHTWSYDLGRFVKEDYKLVYSLNSWIEEADHCMTAADHCMTATEEGERITLRSGCGMVLKSELKWTLTKNNRKCASTDWLGMEGRLSYLYLENGFQEKPEKTTQIKDFSTKVTHYTPVWTPDGTYTIFVKFGGFWTPAGELTAIGKIECEIKGSIFDQYFVTQG